MQRFKRDQPTVGILAGWSPYEGGVLDHYVADVVRGIQSAALMKQCNLLIAWGVGRVIETTISPAWPVLSSESDFVPVGPWNTDGLIVFAPLRTEERSQYLQNLIAEGHPILFIATGEQGPTISVNGKQGIHQGVAHLIEHGHRRIAFVAGSANDTGGSSQRLQAFYSVMKEHELEVDSKLIAWGSHRTDEGYIAMREILDSGVEFTAVMASNDNSAVGAMRAIREANRQIPGDIAIVGFDDQPSAMAQVPPLTSVYVPLTMIGEQALVSMFDHLTFQKPLESIQVATRLVRRQSCGCIPVVISSAVSGATQLESASTQQYESSSLNFQSNVQTVVSKMLAVLPAKIRFPAGQHIDLICTKLVEVFCTSLNKGSLADFQTTLMEFVSQLEGTGGSSDLWQEFVSVLRREMFRLPANWAQARTRYLAEDLLHQMRAAISENVQRQDYRHQYQREIAAHSLGELTARLSATLNEQQAVQLLNLHLADAGIQHARVALFEPENDDPVAWSVVLNSDNKLAAQRFATETFPPPDLYPPGELLNVALLPLVFQNEPIGYVAFEASDLGPCAAIARQLAATIKACRLHAQVVELSLSDALTGLNNRRSFDLFLKNSIAQSRRTGRNLAIILVDVDNFKAYNDIYGHLAGDEVLQQVANCLTKNRRSADIVARLGGDEFVIILPETEINGARIVSENIRTAIANLSDLKRPVSVSIGITSSATLDADTLLRQADKAMYESKRIGKNQVSLFASGRSPQLDEDS